MQLTDAASKALTAPFTWLAVLSGFALVGFSDEAIEMSDTWIVIAMAVAIPAAPVATLVLGPATRAAAALAGKLGVADRLAADLAASVGFTGAAHPPLAPAHVLHVSPACRVASPLRPADGAERRLPGLVGILRRLLAHFAQEPPDVFVGVDFNVFNLLLERRLKRRGIPTVHYVSPSVYAWRRGRIKRIAGAADVPWSCDDQTRRGLYTQAAHARR